MSATLATQLSAVNTPSTTTVGQNRLLYTPAWIQAQMQIITWGQAAGLQVTCDDLGSVYLDLPGTLPGPAIATGSHIDTVRNGGQFDGLYGILAGFQAITQLKRQLGVPQHTLRLITFSEEEGSRFPVTFSGSKHYIRQSLDLQVQDAQGITFDAARQTAVTTLQAKTACARGLPALPATFTEVHIEQGPQLENAHKQIGLVAGIVGQRRLTIQIVGCANHAGTTPMSTRHDALQAAVWLIAHCHARARQLSAQLTFTVGQLEVTPNSANVIPGTATCTMDFRHPDQAILDQFEAEIHQLTRAIPDTHLQIRIDRWVNDQPVHLDGNLLARNQRLASRLGLSHQVLISGAGHDSAVLSQVAPTTMLFVPSVNGISHAPAEFTAPADLAAGITLLMASLREQAYPEVTPCTD